VEESRQIVRQHVYIGRKYDGKDGRSAAGQLPVFFQRGNPLWRGIKGVRGSGLAKDILRFGALPALP